MKGSMKVAVERVPSAKGQSVLKCIDVTHVEEIVHTFVKMALGT